MTSVTVQEIDESALSPEKRNSLAILKNLPVEKVDALKKRFGLSNPGIVGPTTLDTLHEFFVDQGIKLTPEGISAFKAANNIGDAPPNQGIIGTQTAEAIYNQITQKKINPNQELVRVAATYVGVVEKGGNNRGKEVEMFQKAVDGKAVGEPWCMAFAQFCIEKVEESAKVNSKVFQSEHCLTVWQNTPKELKVKLPEPGCLVIWKVGSSGAGHVGIVEKVNPGGKTFTTIEGNTSGGGGLNRDGGGVFRKQRDADGGKGFDVVGFIKPF